MAKTFGSSIKSAPAGLTQPAGQTGSKSARSTRSGQSSIGTSIYASTVLSVDTAIYEGVEEESLNDQQWVLQRKKIGLSRRYKSKLLYH